MLYIRRATLLTPTERINNGALLTDGTRIASVGPVDELVCPEGAQIVEAAGLYLTPGFIDVQVNGASGYDFTADPASIWSVAADLPRYGVTAFLPTIITSPLGTVAAAQEILTQAPVTSLPRAIPLGLHVEGPFLNPEKKGAHNPGHLRPPDPAEIDGWSLEQGVRLVTLAPELPGALELVTTLTQRGVVVSAGHSNATYAEAQAGLDAGIRYGTHLFNAMPTLHHREPGLVGALLTDPRPTVGLIADGIHTHPAIVCLAWQVLGSTRLNLVTDAIAALGMPPGRHVLGDFRVTVDESGARLDDGTLAGSVLSLDQALRNLITFSGCSLAEALPTVTTTPAKLLGLADQSGQLTAGFAADLVLLSPELEVVMTVVQGQIAYQLPTYSPGGGSFGARHKPPY
jgi:N-acetylglucosamine-6-phosphate deacetylase